MRKHKIGVAMSGGSTKGAYQAGALLALKELEVLQHITYFIGTSVGAINSAAMTTLEPEELIEVWYSLKKRSDIFSQAWYKIWDWRGIFSLSPIEKKMKSLMNPDNPKNVEAVACTVSLENSWFEKRYCSNRIESFDDWFQGVMDSATIPFLMTNDKETLRFDGGLREYIPVQEAVKNCEKVITIATAPIKDNEPEVYKFSFPKWFWYLWRTVDGAMQQETKVNDYLKECEKHKTIDIKPFEKLDIGTFEVSYEKTQMSIDRGYKDTLKQKDELLKLIQ